MDQATATADVSQRDAADQSQRDADNDGGQDTQRATDQQQQQSADQSVSYSTYQKVLTEKKNIQARLKEYQDKEAQTMPEQERLQKERDQLDKELTELRAEIRTGRITSAAQKAGALYPDAVVRLVPDDADDYEKAVKEVQKAYPALFPRGNADGGAATNGANNNELDMNSLIRRAAGRQ